MTHRGPLALLLLGLSSCAVQVDTEPTPSEGNELPPEDLFPDAEAWPDGVVPVGGDANTRGDALSPPRDGGADAARSDAARADAAAGIDARPGLDTGIPVRDTGTTVRDTGTVVRDTGIRIDNGTVVRDTGTVVRDTGGGTGPGPTPTDSGGTGPGPGPTTDVGWWGDATTGPIPGEIPVGPVCHGLLRELGVDYTIGGATMGVVDPVVVRPPIDGVHYRYASYTAADQPLLMDCRLGVALVRLSRELRTRWNIDTVQHIGIYNYRPIAGSTTLSQHSYAMAIDLGGFRDTSGQTYTLLTDFVANGAPTCPPRATNARDRVLKEIACWMYDTRAFNIVLTPNYNADHRNHFHVDLTTGSHFIGFDRPEGVDPPHNEFTDFLIDDE